MDLNGIAAYLNATGIVVSSRTLFVHHMPDSVKQGVLLLGRLAGSGIDQYVTGLRRGGFQIIVRHQSYSDGIQLAETLSNVLTIRQQQIGQAYYYFIHPRHEPVPYPISKGDNLEISVNFDVSYFYPKVAEADG